MKINKTGKGELDGSLIILVREDQMIDAYITAPHEKAYVKKRLAGEKRLAILNRLDHLVCFRILEKEDTSLTTRLEQARKAVKILGMELVERRIESGEDFRRIYRQLSSSVDGLWILNDPVTYTIDNMGWLEKRCVADRLVCIGQSKKLSEIGFTLSVRPDVSNVGGQAASMVKNIIVRGQSLQTIGVMEPLGTNIYVNRRTANNIGIELSEKALRMATEVIE